MATIYRVDYSEQTGFYVQTATAMEGSSHSGWTDGDINCELVDGWRESEESAVRVWRAECEAAAESYHDMADKILSLSKGPAPVIPFRLMKPELI